MTLLRRLGCVEIWFAVAAFVIGTAALNSALGQETDKPLPAKRAGRDDPSSPGYRLPSNERKGGAQRNKLVATIEETLNGFTPKPPRSKKADEDFFVVGTIDLQHHHAIVDFVIQEGVQQTANFIADFVLGKEPGMIREWRVFARAKTLKVAEVLRTRAKSESIEEQLAAFKLSTTGRKSPDDYFVVGTADLNVTTLHADIRYEILSGVKSAADFIIDFTFNLPKNHRGEWHVFFRAHTQEEADTYIAQLRNWYDTMEQQRAQMAAIYNAKTTRRC